VYFLTNFRCTSLPAGLLPPPWEPEIPLKEKKRKEMDQNETNDSILSELPRLVIHLRRGEQAEHVPGRFMKGYRGSVTLLFKFRTD